MSHANGFAATEVFSRFHGRTFSVISSRISVCTVCTKKRDMTRVAL